MQKRTARLSVLAVIALLSILVLASAQAVRAASTPTISTDQSDYVADSTVTIYGSGFSSLATASMGVTDPNGAITAWTVSADSSGGFTTTYLLDGVTGNYLVTATSGSDFASTTFHDAQQAANIDQCTNGGVGDTPESCLNSLSNWVNGNSNGQKSHWQEGEFIAYRVTVTGLTGSGPHTLDFSWDVVHSSHHAIDYIGSVNATETFSTTGTTFHANNNNPCVDKLPTAQCTSSLSGFNSAASPAGSISIPAANLAGATSCDSASGTFSGSQIPGKIFIWGATGTSISAFTYLTENSPSGTGQCTTSARLTFNSGSGATVVIAWGGHIASSANWGVGNSAGAISGSPFHTALELLDGASTGSQDRALATSAIFFTPTVSTVVINDSTGLPVVSPIALGTSVHDTTTLTNAATNAGGTVTYKFYTNGSCSGTPLTTQSVSVTNAVVPASSSTGPLTPGSYSYNATYTGDPQEIPLPPNGPCEPFTVSQGSTTTSTALFTSTGTPIALGGTVPLGTTVHDLATVTRTPTAFALTGTVTYTFYTNGSCSGTGTTETVPVGSPSSNHGPLSAGMYSFKATYNGDSNYTGSTSSCEPFQVGTNPTSISTTVVFSDGTPIGSSTPLGSSVKDTSTISGQVGSLTITGTVTYRFYTTIGCTGSFTTEIVTISGGLVPNSSLHGPLAAGSYSFQAVYSGDSNYGGSTSACEPFSVNKADTTISTTIVPAGPYALGSTVHDTSTVGTQVDGFVITGTVTYHFYTTIDCSGSSVDQVLTIAGGIIPDSASHGPLTAGSYSFSATYSGDSNYNGSTSSCEPFTVNQGSTTTDTALFTSAGASISIGGSVPLGTSVHDLATVTATPPAFPLTGTITYTFFTNGSCSGTGATETVAVGSPSSNHGPLAAGDYSFIATYSGDSNYEGSTSSCEPFHVARADTNTTTDLFTSTGTPIPLGSSVPLGTSVYDIASVGPTVPPFTITGTVTYNFYNNGSCSGTPVFTETIPIGSSSSVQGPLMAGSYSFNAMYNGNSNYNPSALSTCEPFTVNTADITITTSVFDETTGTTVPISGSISLGDTVHDTATVGPQVNGFVITGTVTYNFYSGTSCSGTPLSTETVTLVGGLVPDSGPHGPLMAGDYGFQASYSGDSNYNPSTSACEPFTVNKATTTTTTAIFTSSAVPVPLFSSIPLGTSVQDLATVTGSPFPLTGVVQYLFSTSGCAGPFVPFGAPVPPGTPSMFTGPLPTGSYAFLAGYTGDSNYVGSISACEPFTVSHSDTTTVTAIFTSGGVPVPLFSSVPLGTQVHDLATTGPAVPPFPITGVVTYTLYNNGACSGAVLMIDPEAVNTASVNTPPLTAGSYSFQAVYSGDANYNGSTSTCEPFNVSKADTTTTTAIFTSGGAPVPLSSSLPLGTSVQDTATVTGSPFPVTGTVQYLFSMNGCTGPFAAFGAPVLVGAPSTFTGPLPAGSYAFMAVYSGDSNYNGSTSACEPFTVNQASTTTTTTLMISPGGAILPEGDSVSLGTSMFDTATTGPAVPGFPITGTVTYYFYNNFSCSGTVPAFDTEPVNTASVPTGPLMAGPYSFQAVYSGDSNYSGSTSSCEPFAIAQATNTTTTALFTSTGTPIPLGSSVLLATSVYDTATVSAGGPPPFPITGTITYTFFTNGSCSGTGTTETVPVGSSSSVHGPLGAGSYSFMASYSGDSNYAPSTSGCEPFSVEVPPTTTVTALFTSGGVSIPLGSSVPLATMVHDLATTGPAVPGFPITGTVTYYFYTNGDCSGTGVVFDTEPVNTASINTGPLAAGSYSFKAVYSGDTNYNGSTSDCEPFTVNQGPTTTVTALFTSSSISIPLGGTVPLGTSVYDTATVGPAVPPYPITGTITYTFFTNGGCSGTGTTETVPVGSPSSVHGPLGAGSYSFMASYSGDTNYTGSTSSCEPFNVSQADTTTVTALFTSTGTSIPIGGSVPLGTSVYDTATVGPSVPPFTITGTVTFNFYNNGSCTGTPVFTETVPLGSPSTTQGPLMAGSYSFNAQYNGDTNYNASPVSVCEPFTVNKGTSSTVTALFTSTGTAVPLGGSVPVGTMMHDLAAVTVTPPAFPITGTVTYFFSTNGCAGPFAAFDTELVGSASINTAALTPGSYAFKAMYNGNANYDASPLSACEPFAVLKANPSITTSLSATTGNIGSSVTDTATITGGYFTGGPAGSVTYYVYGPFSSLATSSCSGTPYATSSAFTVTGNGPQSSFTVTLNSFGVYQFQAVYSGNTNNNGATSACNTEVFTASPQNTLTDTQFCPLPNNQFRLIYITDPANPGVFRMVSSNPGQFYDNVFDLGAPSTPVTLTIRVPYPFITNGAFPIQVSSGFTFTTINGVSCFVPTFDQNGNFAITTSGGQLSSSGHPIITLADYGTTPVTGTTYTTVTVTGLIPASGLVYVTIHLDYGLKGTTGWNKATTLPVGPCTIGTPGSNTSLYPSWTVYVCDPQSYSFSFTDGTPSSTTPTSVNVWKKDPGIAGVVTDSQGNPIAGATVKIYDNKGNLLGITTTDVNGVYLFVYKYTGSKVNFTIVVQISPTQTQTQTIQMQSNKLVLANFVF